MLGQLFNYKNEQYGGGEVKNITANDVIGLFIICVFVVEITHEFIKWFFGVNEISKKLDKIIKLLEQRENEPK